jgi:hypothetical protein
MAKRSTEAAIRSATAPLAKEFPIGQTKISLTQKKIIFSRGHVSTLVTRKEPEEWARPISCETPQGLSAPFLFFFFFFSFFSLFCFLLRRLLKARELCRATCPEVVLCSALFHRDKVLPAIVRTAHHDFFPSGGRCGGSGAR